VNWQLYRRWTAVAALAVGLVCCALPEQPYIKAEKDRKPAPDFSLKDASGASVKLSDYRGKVVLLNFWATWCGPCEEEIPWFIGFQQEFKDRDFAVLGISVDEDGWDAVKPFVARRKVNYQVVLGGEEVSQIYGDVENLPTTFIIDREGRIARTHIGLVSRNTYKQEILQLMGSPKQNDSYRSGLLNFPHGLLAFLRAR
jgi:peroxiredoxin